MTAEEYIEKAAETNEVVLVDKAVLELEIKRIKIALEQCDCCADETERMRVGMRASAKKELLKSLDLWEE